VTAAADAAAMRSNLVVAALLVASCASKAAPEPDWEIEPVPPAAASDQQVVQVYDVADLVDPPGVADLAETIREATTFLYAGVDPDATVQERGTTIVVKAKPHVQARVRNFLLRRRAGVSPNGI